MDSTDGIDIVEVVVALIFGGGILAGATMLYCIFKAFYSYISSEQSSEQSTIIKNNAITPITPGIEQLPQLELEVINSAWECKKFLARLIRDCRNYCVLGFDTEYVSDWTGRKPIQLLQLCSHSGLCCVISMENLDIIPAELSELLNDRSILKVGVASYMDANYLKQDYSLNVNGHLDLRFLADKLPEYNRGGLKELAKTFLETTEVQFKDSAVFCPKNIKDAAKVI